MLLLLLLLLTKCGKTVCVIGLWIMQVVADARLVGLGV